MRAEAITSFFVFGRGWRRSEVFETLFLECDYVLRSERASAEGKQVEAERDAFRSDSIQLVLDPQKHPDLNFQDEPGRASEEVETRDREEQSVDRVEQSVED